MRKFISIFVAALFSVTMFATETTTLYCKVTQSWWTNDGAAVGVHYWGGTSASTTWPGIRMTPVGGGVWSYDVPSDVAGLIFVRVNGSGDISDYGAKTGNLTIPTDGKNLYTITSDTAVWGNPGVAGEWSVYVPQVPAKFYITGDSALVVDAGLDKAKAWNPDAIKSEKDTFILNLKAGQDYLIKLALNGTWIGENNVKGFNELTKPVADGLKDVGDDHNIGFKLKTAGQVKVIYKADLFKIEGDFVVPEPEPVKLPVVAIAGNKISKWKADSLILVPAKDSLTASITVDLKAGIDSFKIVSDGNWLSLNGEGESCYTFHRDWTSASHINGVDLRNFILNTDVAGEYTFTWTFADSTLAITFPAEPKKKTIYFKATQGYWNWLDGEHKSATAAYLFGEGGDNGTWPGARLTKVAGEEFVWSMDVDTATFQNIIFIRVNAEGAFSEMGLKTKDLVLPKDEKNLYTITLDEIDWDHFDWSKGIEEGEWSTYVAPIPAKFYMTGDSAFVTDAGYPGKAWNDKAIKSEKDTFVLNLKANQEYLFKVIEDGNWEGGKIKGYDELSEKTEGLSADKDRNICFKLAEAGEVKVIYFWKDEQLTFKVAGNFYVEPAKPKVTLKLVPGEAAKDNAKFAVWCWGPKQPGAWTEFFAGEGDTLTTQIEQDLDSVIFARFCDKASEPKWGGTGNDTIWNNTGHKGIDYDGLTFTITSMFDGQWEAYIPQTPAKFYITGDSALVTDAGYPGKQWNPGAIKSEKDTFILNLKADQDYVIKLTLNGTWDGENNVKGFNELTKPVTEGLKDLGEPDHNIGFKLKAAGQVKVIYKADLFKIEGDFVVEEPEGLANGYYLIRNPWTVESINEVEKFVVNPMDEKEFQLEVTLVKDEAIKVVEVENNAIKTWFPEGVGTEYTVDDAHAGEKIIYFRPDGAKIDDDAWKPFGGYFYIEANATAIDNTNAEVKAVKVLFNGQLLIKKNGRTYTVTGAEVR